MRSFLLLFLLILGSYINCHALIGIGYSYKNVLFWRFWEMKEGQLVPEMLVYNTGDTAISFTMRKTYVEGGCTPSGTTKEEYARRDAEYAKDTIVNTTVIPPHQYGIFVVSRGQYGNDYNGAFVNGRWAGISGKMQEPSKEIIARYPYKYYSYEGEYGTPGWGLTCTDQIFTKRGEKGHLAIYFDFNDPKKWQSFAGISDVSATIGGGLDDAAITLNGQMHTIKDAQKNNRFAANMGSTQTYRMDVSFTVAENGEFPNLDMHYFFANGNAGIEMPIFVQ